LFSPSPSHQNLQRKKPLKKQKGLRQMSLKNQRLEKKRRRRVSMMDMPSNQVGV
jgi:hypothetical protein